MYGRQVRSQMCPIGFSDVWQVQIVACWEVAPLPVRRLLILFAKEVEYSSKSQARKTRITGIPQNLLRILEYLLLSPGDCSVLIQKQDASEKSSLLLLRTSLDIRVGTWEY
jgi:hypothetical protein